MKKTLLLIIIFFIAAYLRFINLGNIPVGFHIDEAIIADNANFILQTGRDTNNSFLPLQTEVFGDYNPTGYAYLAIPAIKIFGLTEFATRIPGALLGALTAISVFFLIYALFESKPVALISSLLFAVSPWDIVLSRSSEQTAVAIFFVVSGFACIIWSLRREKISYLAAGFLFLFLSYFMYFTPRVFVPLFFLSLFLPIKYWWKKRHELYTKLLVITFIFLTAFSAFLIIGVNGGSSRFNQVSIFSFPSTKLIQEEQIREDGVSQNPILETRSFHNKPIAYGYTYVSNYLQYFTADFLFLKGGLPIWFRTPQMGLLYLIELPFILFGALCLYTKKKKWSYLLFTWILLSPFAAAVTVDDVPNIRRALLMVPMLEALAAYGVVSFLLLIPKKIKKPVIGLLVVIFSYSVSYFIHAYFVHAPINKNWYRNEGFDLMIDKVKQAYNDYDYIIITKNNGGIYSEILFYTNYDPAKYLKEGATKDAEYTGFGKFFFVPQACPSIDKDSRFPSGKKFIYVDSGECREDRLIKERYMYRQEYILRKDGTKVFRIVYE